LKSKSKLLLILRNIHSFCVAGKEYLNKEGYTAYDLFLPKTENKKYPITNVEDSLLSYDDKNIL
jgi:hypothetical protein